MAFKKAIKSKIKLRGAIFGPSGSGKTMTGLRILKGLGCEKVAVIDSERGSALRYADRFDFLHDDLVTFEVEEYISKIKEAQAEGCDGLMIDSMSHAWSKVLETVDKLAAAKFSGNTFRAWTVGTPLQHKFIDAVLGFNGHLIATMRSKTEWVVEQNDRGKATPKRVGTSPTQGKDIEYEFDFLLEMNQENLCTVIKDRTGMFQGKLIEKPNEEFGKALADWLSKGEEPVAPKQSAPPLQEPPKQSPKSTEAVSTSLDEVITRDMQEVVETCSTTEEWQAAQKWMQEQSWYPKGMKLANKIFKSSYEAWRQLDAQNESNR